MSKSSDFCSCKCGEERPDVHYGKTRLFICFLAINFIAAALGFWFYFIYFLFVSLTQNKTQHNKQIGLDELASISAGDTVISCYPCKNLF